MFEANITRDANNHLRYLHFSKSHFQTGSIHLSPDCVSFLGKDVLEISELKSNMIIGNLFIWNLHSKPTKFLGFSCWFTTSRMLAVAFLTAPKNFTARNSWCLKLRQKRWLKSEALGVGGAIKSRRKIYK